MSRRRSPSPTADKKCDQPDPVDGQRIDKWLWCARIFKTRARATREIADGAVRLTRDGETRRISRASFVTRAGDEVAVAVGAHVKILRVLDIGKRRGPATEAALLYEDLTPPKPLAEDTEPASPRSGARPTKKDRRSLDALTRSSEDPVM